MNKKEAREILKAFAILENPTKIAKVNEALRVLFLPKEFSESCETCFHQEASSCRIDDSYIHNTRCSVCKAYVRRK